MRVLNSAQMREADRRTIGDIGIPSLVLMENAGRQVVAAMEAMHGELLERQVAVLCGPGNNGGDGFVVARTLMQRGVSVSVFLMGRAAAAPRGEAGEADAPGTRGAPKLPLVLPPGEARAGDVVIADIGIPAEVIESLEGPRIALLTRGGMRELVTPRVPDSHKGDYGR